MIADDEELSAMLKRIAHVHPDQLSPNDGDEPSNYHVAVSGFLAELDRMQLEVREYLSFNPAELTGPTYQPSS